MSGARAGGGRWAVGRLGAMALSLAALCMPTAWGAGQSGGAAGQPDERMQNAGPVAIPAARAAQNVAIITIDREIDAVMARSVERRLEAARASGADAVVMELDTPGGEIGAVLEICGALKQTPLHTVGWVHHEAYSGGAIIALACDEIVASSAATMGDAGIISMSVLGMINEMSEQERQKFLAPLLAEVVDSARRNGYDEKLVQGIVSRGVELWLVESVDDPSQRMFIDRAEHRLLFGEPSASESAAMPSASPTGGEGAPPAAGPAEGEGVPDMSAPSSPVDEATRFAPASPEFSQSLVDQVSMSQQLPGTRRALTSADRDAWRKIGKFSDGRGFFTFKTTDLLRYGLAAPGTAEKATVDGDEDLRRVFGATNIARLNETWSERMVAFLSGMIVRGLLIVVFLLGLFIEMTHPGLVLPGAVAAVALVLLITVPFMNNMAGWWEVAAVLGGILALGIEIFVIPGFGVFGVVGLVLLFGGLLGTFIGDASPLFPDSPQRGRDLIRGATTILMAGVTAGVLMWFVGKHLGSLPMLGRLVLKEGVIGESDDEDEGLLAAMEHESGAVRVGAEGVALTPLRPAGRVRIADSVIDAVAELGFIESGAPVRVTAVESFRVAVERIDDGAPRA